MGIKSVFQRLTATRYGPMHVSVILLVPIFVYWRVHTLSFLIGWDDQAYVTNRYTENGLFAKNIYAIFTEFYRGQYAPINQLYYSFLFAIFDYSTSAYHIAGLFIHLANSVIVYLLIRIIARQLIGEARQANAIAFFTSLVFSIAPINLEAVAWVAASKVLLYAFFYLLSLLCYLKYVIEKSEGYYYLLLAGFVLSFGAKEQAVTLPFAMLCIDYVYKRDFRSFGLWYEKIPLCALSMTFALASVQSQTGNKWIVTNYYTLGERALLSLYTMMEYLTKTAIPVNLSFVYPFPFQPGATPPVWIWIYPLAVPAAIFCLWRWLSKPWIAWGGLFFLTHIFLVSNIINLSRYSAIADRYAYVASIGIYFIIVTFVFKTANRHALNRIVALPALAYFMFFCVYTKARLPVWESAVSLKRTLRETIQARSDYGAWKARHNTESHEKH